MPTTSQRTLAKSPSIYTDGQNYIRIDLRGKLTATNTQLLVLHTSQLIQDLHAKNIPAHVVISLKDIDSYSDMAVKYLKNLWALPVEKIAIVGSKQKYVALFGIYEESPYIEHFEKRSDAQQWLNEKPPANNTNVSTVIFGIVTAITVFILSAWIFHLESLKNLSPTHVYMNPLTALCLLVATIASYLCVDTIRVRKKRLLARAMSMFVGAIGAIIFVSNLVGKPSTIDQILFHDILLRPQNESIRIAPNTGLNLIILGILLALISRKFRSYRSIVAAQVCVGLIVVGSVLGLSGYVYNLAGLTNSEYFRSTAPITSLTFILIATGILVNYPYVGFMRKVRALPRALLLSISVFILIQALTGFAWQQANNRIITDTEKSSRTEVAVLSDHIDERLRAYTDNLYGFRAFFESSDSVTRLDFHNYYTNTNVANKYPGINAVSFIENVKKSELEGFIENIHRDTTFANLDLSHVSLHPNITKTEYNLVTYVEPNVATSNYGFDLSSNAERNTAFIKARDSGEPVMSPTIDLNIASDPTQKRPGFIITMPVYGRGLPTSTPDQRRSALSGYVNAVFDYRTFFSGALNETLINSGDGIIVRDAETNTVLYSHVGSNPDTSKRVVSNITPADRNWEIELRTSPSSGLSTTERSVPVLFLVTGTALAALTAVTVYTLANRREEALRLANSITIDLKNEKNSAQADTQRTEGILASIGEGLVLFDAAGNIVRMNQIAEKSLGYSEKHVLGKNFYEALIARQDNGRPIAYENRPVSRVLKTSRTVIDQLNYVKKDGKLVPVIITASPVIIDGELTGVIEVFRDITNERQLEKAKDEFVAIASHQLRTPATAVKQFIGILLEGFSDDLSPEQRMFLQQAYETNERQLEIVNALLNIASLESGKLELRPSQLDVGNLISRATTSVQPIISARKQKLTIELPSKPISARLDGRLFTMAIENLVTNATKYSPSEAEITVKLVRRKGFFNIYVIDTGVGMTKENQKKLFQKFSRIENQLSHQARGTGLGLYLAKQVVEMHGGTIKVRSELGKGSTFTIKVPL